MVSYSSILALERRPDERNQPKVGYAWPGERRAGEGSSLTQRNQLFLGYVFGHCDRGRLRLECDLVTFKRNLVFPSIGDTESATGGPLDVIDQLLQWARSDWGY